MPEICLRLYLFMAEIGISIKKTNNECENFFAYSAKNLVR